MNRSKRTLVVVALLVLLALVLAACGSDGGSAKKKPSGTTGGGLKSGGTATFAAEQELATADWISSDAGSSWGSWTYTVHTIPRAFDQTGGKYIPNPVLAGAPTVQASPQQVVTYKLNPKAVWSDGEPITSADFKYTWDQIANGSDIYDTTGYRNIESVGTPDPQTAVVTFATGKPYAAWRDLFGGFYGILPSHLLEGKDRNALMKDGYDWSGGPWICKWNKGQNITCTKNPKWYGPKKPLLDKVVFKFITDTAAEAEAFKTRQVSMAYPQPQVETADLFKLQGVKHLVTAQTTSLEALWINASREPFTSKAVRQAMAYSLNRDAIVKALFGALDPTLKASQSLNFNLGPGSAAYYRPTFARYTKNLQKVATLMEGDGWAKGSDGIWAKGGQRASFNISTTTGNARRATTEELLQSAFKAAGFEVKTPFDNAKSDILFGTKGPQGDFDTAIYAQVGTYDPSMCTTLCTANIPSPANENNGQNWTRLDDPAINAPWEAADSELDVAKRNDLIKQGQAVTADLVPAIPLDPLPDVVVWYGNIIGGPIGDNPIYGPWVNMEEFGLTK